MPDLLEKLFNPENAIASLILIAVALLVAFVLHFLLFNTVRKIAKRTNADYLYEATKKLNAPGLMIFLIVAVIIVLPLIALRDVFEDNVRHILSILIIFNIAWFIIQGIAIVRQIVLEQYSMEDKDNLRARKVYTQFRMLERIIIFIIIIIALATALMTFETIKQVGVSILASAGIAGIIIGFAAQRVIATIFAGFQIAITQPIRLDDVVIVEGEYGWIEEITLTYAVIRLWDKRRLIVPTTYFIENPFQNWTRVSADILGAVYIYTDYNVPVEALRKELTRLLENSDFWDKNVNALQVTNSTEKTIELRALMSAADSPSAWNLRVYVRENLIKFLQENYPECLPKLRITDSAHIEKDKPGFLPA